MVEHAHYLEGDVLRLRKLGANALFFSFVFLAQKFDARPFIFPLRLLNGSSAGYPSKILKNDSADARAQRGIAVYRCPGTVGERGLRDEGGAQDSRTPVRCSISLHQTI